MSDTPSRERTCPHAHATIADGIRCAQRNLGVQPGHKLQPYWGTTRQNAGLIVGWQLSSRKRWRLDYDERKGPHINEENFDLPRTWPRSFTSCRDRPCPAS